jgi:hypothetical protein
MNRMMVIHFLLMATSCGSLHNHNWLDPADMLTTAQIKRISSSVCSSHEFHCRPNWPSSHHQRPENAPVSPFPKLMGSTFTLRRFQQPHITLVATGDIMHTCSHIILQANLQSNAKTPQNPCLILESCVERSSSFSVTKIQSASHILLSCITGCRPAT